MTGSGETETRLRALARKLEALSAVGAPTSERARVRSEHARVLRAVDAEQALANALLALSEAHSIESEEPEETRARTVAACEATVAICYQTVGDDACALEHALSGLEALGELEDDLTRFRLHNAQAVVYNNFGQADRALASYAEAREAAAHLQDATPLSVLNTNIACVYLEILDQPDRAIPHLDRALAIEGVEPIARVWALQALGRAQNRCGEHELALGFAREAEDIAERHGLLGSVSASLLVAGDALRALERDDEAREALERSVEVARRAHAQDMLADALTALGECEAAAGHADAARAALEEASELTADRNPTRHPLSALASLAAATGDHASAYAYLMRFHEIVQRSADERSRMASSALEVEHQVADGAPGGRARPPRAAAAARARGRAGAARARAHRRARGLAARADRAARRTPPSTGITRRASTPCASARWRAASRACSGSTRASSTTSRWPRACTTSARSRCATRSCSRKAR